MNLTQIREAVQKRTVSQIKEDQLKLNTLSHQLPDHLRMQYRQLTWQTLNLKYRPLKKDYVEQLVSCIDFLSDHITLD